MCTTMEKKKKISLDPNSSRASNTTISGIHQYSRSSRQKWSLSISQTRTSSIMGGGRKTKRGSLDRSANQTSNNVRVLDSDGKDVTPKSLYHAEPEVTQSKAGRFFLDEIFPSSGSDCLKSASTLSVSSARNSQLSSLSADGIKTSLTEDGIPKSDIPVNPPAPCEVLRERDGVKHVTDEMMDEEADVSLSETDTVSLLDIPPTFVSEDAEDAEAIKGRNLNYVELCKTRVGNAKYVVRSTQTFDGALKDKKVQSDKTVMVEKGTVATNWKIYDSFSDQNETPESEESDFPKCSGSTSKSQEKTGAESSRKKVSTGRSIGSVSNMEMCGISLNTETDLQLIMLSESFQHSLLVMERSIVGNIFQTKLAAYKRLPILQDPDSTEKPRTEQQTEEGEESSLILEHLWTFSCELTNRCNIMAWNKENPDILAVGYGDYDPDNPKPGLICCWSLKNPMWPERIFHCHSCATSLDFSADSPNLLAVGMFDGTVAIYNVQCQNKRACIADSSGCEKKHHQPVWQIRWTKQTTESVESREEVLVSVSADGRIVQWILCATGLKCSELMVLKRMQIEENRTETERCLTGMSNLVTVTPVLCVDFNPTDSSIYLIGTWKGPIHKCSLFNQDYFLDVYKEHSNPVNYIEWSPFNADVFLSCSSDWTIQLWKQDHSVPVLSFTSTQTAVYTVRWSPDCSTIFAAINEEQLEIWDLNASILDPTIVHRPAPCVKLTSLLFARGTDCVLVGDSDGRVNVYQLKNLSAGKGKQVNSLEDIIHAEVSRKLQILKTAV